MTDSKRVAANHSIVVRVASNVARLLSAACPTCAGLIVHPIAGAGLNLCANLRTPTSWGMPTGSRLSTSLGTTRPCALSSLRSGRLLLSGPAPVSSNSSWNMRYCSSSSLSHLANRQNCTEKIYCTACGCTQHLTNCACRAHTSKHILCSHVCV